MSNTPITVPDDEFERLRAAITAGDWETVAMILGSTWTRTEVLGPDDAQRSEISAAVEDAGHTVDGLIEWWNSGAMGRGEPPPGGDDAPIDGDDVETVLATIADMDPDEAWIWLTEHAGELSEEAFNAGQKFADDAEDPDAPPEVAVNVVAEQVMEEGAYADALAEAADAVAERLGQTRPGVAPDLSDIPDLAPPGLSPTQMQDFIAAAREAGQQQAIETRAGEIQGQTGATDDEAAAIAQEQVGSVLGVLDSSTPPWLLEFANGELSDQQKDRYVDYWNDAHGKYFRDFDTDLAPILSRFDGTEAEVQNFANAVLADQEPLLATLIELPLVDGRRRVSYTEGELEDLRAMGFDTDAVTRLVRLAGITAGADAITPGAAGDTLNVAPLAALVRYHGGGQEFARFNQTQQDIADIEQRLGLRPGQYSAMTMEEREALREELRRDVSGPPAAERAEWDRIDDTFTELESKLGDMARREERGALPGILAANNNFKRGMDLYRGDQPFALVHAVDPVLAQRLESTGGNADELDWEDNAAIYDILERGGVVEGSNVRLRQLESATGFFGYFDTGRGARGGGGGGGGAAEVRRQVDPVAVKEQVQQLWSRMFLADVDDATVNAITSNLQKQLDEAPDGMSFDVSARIQQFLRGQDVYDQLYRNKPEGVSEEEYQGMMAQGVGDILGAETDVGALRAGMETGDYQTAVGRAASTEKLLTNSTLRGRWAGSKQSLDRFS